MKPLRLSFVLILALALLGPNAFAAVGGGDPTFSTTTSTTNHTTFTDYFLDAIRSDTFVTRLTAALAGGPILFDQTFNHPFSSLIVQNAVNDAKNILTLAASGPISFTGPTLLSSQEDFLGSVPKNTQGLNHTETSITTSTTFGPATILIGENQSQTFFVNPGSTNVNVNTHTESFVDRSFQSEESYQLSQHFGIEGNLIKPVDVSSPVPDPNTAAAPEPATLFLFGSGLLTLFFRKKN